MIKTMKEWIRKRLGLLTFQEKQEFVDQAVTRIIDKMKKDPNSHYSQTLAKRHARSIQN